MIISNNYKLNVDGKTFSIGGKVWANEASDYAGLIGHVTEIRTGDDKETENEGPEICCCFDVPEREAVVRKIEARFSELYQMPKRIEDLALDNVVMAPEMLEPVAETLPDNVETQYTLSLYSDGIGVSCITVLGASTDFSVLLRIMLDDVDSYDIPVVFSYCDESEAGTHYVFETDDMTADYLYLDYIISVVPVYASEEGVCLV